MANRVQEDLKLIVGIDDTLNGVVPGHASKDSISGKRGIVYFNADGSSESTSGNPPSEDEEGNKEEGTTQPDAEDSNGGNSTEDAGLDDPYPVDDPAQTGSGIFSFDGMTLGDIVKGLSGLKDCATGDLVDVRFDGQFTAPEGWDSPTPDPLPDGYEAGYYWEAQAPGYMQDASPSNLAARAASNYPSGILLYITTVSETFKKARIQHSGTIEFDVFMNRYACGQSQASYCEVLPEAWPASKPMELSYNSETGRYETNPYDTNVTTEYSQPVSQFELCSLSGDPIKSYPTADGGQAIHNETTGVATFIDASGKVTGFGDGQSITNNLPR